MYDAGYDIREAASFWEIMMNNTKDENFINKITGSTMNLLNSIEGELEADLLENLGDQGIDILVTQILDTVYTSHPLAVKRYGNINKHISEIYENTEWANYIVGQDGFEKSLSSLID